MRFLLSGKAALTGLLAASLAAGLWLASGCGQQVDMEGEGPKVKAPAGPPFFADVTAASGVKHTYRNGEESNHYAILESLGGGAAVFDYDGDGLLDVYLTGGGHYDRSDEAYKKDPKQMPNILGIPGKLYKNAGNLKFKDVTQEAGLAAAPFYSNGAAAADYDRDGHADLLVTGYGRVALYRNEADGKGGRKFRDVTKEAGLLGDHFWSTSAAWADFDGDGHADLYVCQYVNWGWEGLPGLQNPVCGGYTVKVKRDVCPPKSYDARPHAVYRNTGKGTFEDVTKAAGLRWEPKGKPYSEAKDFGKGLGVIAVDVNDDRRPDLYVANDTTDNFLYLNRSKPGQIQFEEVGMPMGVARDDRGIANGSMGMGAADIDGSGRASLWTTNYEGELHGLYRNVKQGQQQYFVFSTQTSGIAAIGQTYVGFGTEFTDFDNDGLEDLFVVNGHVIRHPARDNLRQAPVLLRALGPVRFADVTDRGGEYARAGHRGRGLAVGDLDNDGKADLVISNVEEPAAVLRNVCNAGNRWVGVELAGRDRRDTVGTRLTLEVDGKKLTRFAKGGGSYLSSNDPRQRFGVGPAQKVGTLTVEWATGEPRTEHWDNLALDRYHRIEQGKGRK
jgi:hypothetical protein